MNGTASVPRTGAGGFSLIELMIATAVFSIGMGGMSALMLSASGGMSEAEHESLANLHADAMAATLQLSPLALDHLANPPETAPVCFESNDCTHEEFTIGSYLLWRSRISQTLPGGAATICRDSTPLDGIAEQPSCDGSGPVVTKVFWFEPAKADDPDSGNRRAVVQVPQ